MKRTLVITTLITAIILMSSYIASSTYAFINNISENTNIDIQNYEAFDDQIIYNYLIDKLSLTDEEAKLVVNSINLNDMLKEILNNNNSLTKDEVSSILTSKIDSNLEINNELKNKLNDGIISNRQEITDYLYSIIQK